MDFVKILVAFLFVFFIIGCKPVETDVGLSSIENVEGKEVSEEVVKVEPISDYEEPLEEEFYDETLKEFIAGLSPEEKPEKITIETSEGKIKEIDPKTLQ